MKKAKRNKNKSVTNYYIVLRKREKKIINHKLYDQRKREGCS